MQARFHDDFAMMLLYMAYIESRKPKIKLPGKLEAKLYAMEKLKCFYFSAMEPWPWEAQGSRGW